LTVTHRDTWFPGVVCAGDLVELPDALGPVERVGLGAGLLVSGGREHPPHVVVGLLGPLKDGLDRLENTIHRHTQREKKSMDFIHPLKDGLRRIDRALVSSYGESDDVVEALELEVGEAPARPGARVGDVEVVPPRRGGEPGGAVPGHEAPEGGRRRIEGPGVGHLVVRRPCHLASLRRRLWKACGRRKWRTGRGLRESFDLPAAFVTLLQRPFATHEFSLLQFSVTGETNTLVLLSFLR